MLGLKVKYDVEGNRIAKGDVKYFWDHRNRLVKVISPSETIEYTYDYQNRLVSRKTEKGKEYFVHDGWQIVLILNGNGSVKERLLWGTKQDELICENDQWTLGDHLNTIREVVDASGKTLAHCDYNAFGKRLNPSSDTLQFAYTGKLTDSATNLQWNINRWYDSSVGRWISEDPIGFEGNDNNIYRYVSNKPVIKTDSLGLWTKADCDFEKDLCDDGCRSMPNHTNTDKLKRALCWSKCMSKYATCLAGAEEAITCYVIGGGIAVASILAACDGPLPFGDACGAAIIIKCCNK